LELELWRDAQIRYRIPSAAATTRAANNAKSALWSHVSDETEVSTKQRAHSLRAPPSASCDQPRCNSYAKYAEECIDECRYRASIF
jgi:hypothetical protein